MKNGLRISDDLTLPVDFVTQMAAILARRGGGKSYCGISSDSGTFTTYLGKLRTLELVEGKSDALVASEELY